MVKKPSLVKVAGKYQAVLKKVLTKITPSKKDKIKLESISKKVLAECEQQAKKYNGSAMLAGSITRDTWINGKMEFDVFVLFPESMSVKTLETIGLKIGKSVIKKMRGKHRIEYAQHPYVCGKVQGVDIDVVPCFEVKSTETLKSAVDRTPFHVHYIVKHLPASASGDVRLLKQFLRAIGAYGADAKTEGFSGFVCELLAINYGSFMDVLKAVTKWQPGQIIDMERFYNEDEHHKLKKQYKQPLILIDPTDKKRNAAAAISAENFYKFIKASKKFLAKPSEQSFFADEKQPITHCELVVCQVKRRSELMLVTFKPPSVVPDILWPQLRSFADRLQSILEETRYEFKVLRKAVYTNESNLAAVLIEMEVSKLPIVQKRVGPKFFDMDDSQRFLDKYKRQATAGPFIEDDNWCVELRRKYVTAREKLIESLDENAKILKAKGIPSFVAEQLAKKYELVMDNERIMQMVKQDKNFGIFLRQYFEKESLI